MTDLRFDFGVNDIVLDKAGNIMTASKCSMQNAALIFNKSAASITQAQLGQGFEEIYPNMPENRFGTYKVNGERQIKEDGAIIATINITKRQDGITNDVDITARYNGE